MLAKALYTHGCHLHRVKDKGWELRNDHAMKGAA
jgi:hypothetical protein